MKATVFILLCSASALSPVLAAPTYSITINGPVVVTEFTCDDPCHVDQQEIVGYSGGGMTSIETTDKNPSPLTEGQLDTKRSHAERGIKCVGDCGLREENTLLIFEHKRKLRNGFKLDIEDESAHFIFYSVTDTENGPATLLQHSQFRIDRPLIELDLHGHAVEVRTILNTQDIGEE